MSKLCSAKIKQSLQVLAFAIVILCAQVATLEHGLDHLSHDAHSLCQAFIGFEKSSAITSNLATLPAVQFAVSYIVAGFEEIYLFSPAAYLVRAPPTLI